MAGDSAVAVLDIIGLDGAAPLSGGAGLETAALPPAVGELPPEDSILSLAQPPTINPKKVSQIIFLSMEAPPVENC